jgi:hypothetical protein
LKVNYEVEIQSAISLKYIPSRKKQSGLGEGEYFKVYYDGNTGYFK